MLYRVGTKHELSMLEGKLPTPVLDDLLQRTILLDMEYGAERNYLESGGYSLIVEAKDDMAEVKQIISYDTHPCEWVTRLGEDGSYLSALYLLNDDFTVTLYLPTAIAPDTILNDLEED